MVRHATPPWRTHCACASQMVSAATEMAGPRVLRYSSGVSRVRVAARDSIWALRAAKAAAGSLRRDAGLITVDADVEGFVLDLGRADEDWMVNILCGPCVCGSVAGGRFHALKSAVATTDGESTELDGKARAILAALLRTIGSDRVIRCDNCRRSRADLIAVALFRGDLEELGDGLDLAADVAVAAALSCR